MALDKKAEQGNPKLSSEAVTLDLVCELIKSGDVAAVRERLDALDPEEAKQLISTAGTGIDKTIYDDMVHPDKTEEFFLDVKLTPVHLAFYYGPGQMVTYLLEKMGCKLPTLKDRCDLHKFLNEHKLITEWIYDFYQTDVERKRRGRKKRGELDTNLLFYAACQAGCRGLVEWMINLNIHYLKDGAKFNIDYSYFNYNVADGETPLCVATKNRRTFLSLLRNGVNVNANSSRALEDACMDLTVCYASVEIQFSSRLIDIYIAAIYTLLRQGADLNCMSSPFNQKYESYQKNSLFHFMAFHFPPDTLSRFLPWVVNINQPVVYAFGEEREGREEIGILEAVCELPVNLQDKLRERVHVLCQAGAHLDAVTFERINRQLSKNIKKLDVAITAAGEDADAENKRALMVANRETLCVLAEYLATLEEAAEARALVPAAPAFAPSVLSVRRWKPDVVVHGHAPVAVRHRILTIWALTLIANKAGMRTQLYRLPPELVVMISEDVFDVDIDPHYPLRIAAYCGGKALQALEQPGTLLVCRDDHGRVLPYRDEDGRTLMHIAAAAGSVEAVQRFLAEGVPVNARDPAGCTALDFAHRRSASLDATKKPDGEKELADLNTRCIAAKAAEKLLLAHDAIGGAALRASKVGAFAQGAQSSSRDSSGQSSAPKAGGAS